MQFGSTVIGSLHPRSDIDVGVLVADRDLPLQALLEIQHGLQQFFPDREVDMAVINRADPLLLKKMMERRVLLYGDPQHLHRLRQYAFKRYQDHRRFFELEHRYVERHLARYRVHS